MYENKRFLLIAGGGTLGTYVSEELLRKGAIVEVVCPEEKTSHCDRLIFHQGMGTEEYLGELFAKTHYDGIVNFIHYDDPEDYKAIHPLLIQNTDHLIFLSSYRVYADEMHPITEEAPRLLDVIRDEEFLTTEDYGLSKAKCEDFLRSECASQPWTIVRPVISFSERRLDLLMHSKNLVLEASDRGEELLLPEFVRNYSAGLDWAGNSGKLIANLLLKPDVIGETYTIYSGHGLTWGEVAQAYERVIGLKVRWCTEEEYLAKNPRILEKYSTRWGYIHDRRYNRDIDCSKVLRATGLTEKDFASVEEGIRREVAKLGR